MCVIVYTSVSQSFLRADPSWSQNIPTDPHVLDHVTRVPGWYVSEIKNLYLRTCFSWVLLYTSGIHNHAWLNL
jgi:hypothetical protein